MYQQKSFAFASSNFECLQGGRRAQGVGGKEGFATGFTRYFLAGGVLALVLVES